MLINKEVELKFQRLLQRFIVNDEKRFLYPLGWPFMATVIKMLPTRIKSKKSNSAILMMTTAPLRFDHHVYGRT